MDVRHRAGSCLVQTRHGCNAFPVPGRRLSWEEMMAGVYLKGGEMAMVLERRELGGVRYCRILASNGMGWLLDTTLEEL